MNFSNENISRAEVNTHSNFPVKNLINVLSKDFPLSLTGFKILLWQKQLSAERERERGER